MNLPHLDPALLVEIVVGAAGFAVWIGLLALALAFTRPADVEPVPPTQEFGGPEPPAVVTLLTNRWELNEDAAESTLIDLAARRILEFRQPANDPTQTTVHVRENEPTRLNPYEQAIFDRVRGLCVSGLVPLTALTFRDQGDAGSFAKRIETAIVEDARARGLSRRRFSAGLATALGTAAGIPALALGGAIALDLDRTHELGDEWGAVLGAILISWFFLAGIAGRPRGERDTPAGQQAASRWLGLQAYLRGDQAFADLPPSAVSVWDRYLSYGDAVGATRVCSALIDLGLGNRKQVWSSFGGGWHRVKVRYPRFWRRYGQKAVPLFVKAIGALVVSTLIYRGSNALPDNFTPDGVSGYVSLAVSIVFLSPLFYGVYTLVCAVVDVAAPVTLTGEVLWVEVWRSKSGGEDNPSIPWLYHFAVDDGREGRTVAWGCPAEIVGQASAGDIVTFTARRWTRRIVELASRNR
jgi:hypothetical protein